VRGKPESTGALLARLGTSLLGPALAGLALGVMSRCVDTSAWAPGWIGLVLSPWLVGTWMAGSRAWTRGAGALLGVTLLASTVAAYLAVAWLGDGGAEAARLAPGLALLTVVAGPLWGTAGAAAQAGRAQSWVPRLAGGAMLGAILVAEGALLQIGEREVPQRVLFAAELLVGLVLAVRVSGNLRGAPLALTTGAVLLALELLALAALGVPLEAGA
jgi:hypothetical protein